MPAKALRHHVFLDLGAVFPQVGRLQESHAVGVAVFQRASFRIALRHCLHDGIVIGRDVFGGQDIIKQDMPIPLILRGLLVGDFILGIQNHVPALFKHVFILPSVLPRPYAAAG